MAGAHAGGAELFFERLTIALHRSGEQVLPIIRTDADRSSRLAGVGLRARELRFGGPTDFITRLRLRHILRAWDPRVAVVWMSRAAKLTPRGRWILVGRLGGYYRLANFRNCDHLVGNTIAIAKWIIGQGWPAHRVHYVPNFAEDLGGSRPIARENLAIGPDRNIVLALGRLHPNKGFDLLIRALPLLPKTDAVIAGDGPAYNELLDLARREGVADRVHFIGWRSDTGALLATADVLVCPSRHEPLGNVIIEAWSAGCPVIAASVDGPRELIANGEGWLIPSGDAGALAEAVGHVLEDKASAQAATEAGRSRFEHEFSRSVVVEQWRSFLSGVEKV